MQIRKCDKIKNVVLKAFEDEVNFRILGTVYTDLTAYLGYVDQTLAKMRGEYL